MIRIRIKPLYFQLLLITGIAYALPLYSYGQSKTAGVLNNAAINITPITNSDSVQVSLNLTLGALSNDQWVEIRYGVNQGSGSYLSKNLQYVILNGKPYLKSDGTFFEIVNGSVTISGVASIPDRKGKLNIKVTDGSGNTISQLNK